MLYVILLIAGLSFQSNNWYKKFIDTVNHLDGVSISVVIHQKQFESTIIDTGFIEIKGKNKYINCPKLCGSETASSCLKKLDQLKSGNVTNSLLRKNFISIGTVMIDRSLLCKLKFDSDFNVIGDFDLWVRASMKTSFHYVDDIIEKSRRHSNNFGTQLKDEWIIEERVLYKKYLRLYGLLRMPMVLVYIIKSELKSIVNRTLFLKKYIEKSNLYN